MSTTPPVQRDSSLKRALAIALIVMLVLVLGWHLILPLLGITILLTAGAWGIIVASIVIFCVAALLFFLIPGIVIAVICVFALLWALVAIIMFPFVFPVIIPLLIILLFIAFLRRRR